MCLQTRVPQSQLPAQLKPEPTPRPAATPVAASPKMHDSGLPFVPPVDPPTNPVDAELGEQYLVGWKLVKPDGNILLSQHQYQDFVWKPGISLATGRGGQDGKGFYLMLKRPTPTFAEQQGLRILPVHFKRKHIVAAGPDQNVALGFCVVVSEIMVYEKDFNVALAGVKQRAAAKRAVKQMKPVVDKAKKKAAAAKKALKAKVSKAKKAVRRKPKAGPATGEATPPASA